MTAEKPGDDGGVPAVKITAGSTAPVAGAKQASSGENHLIKAPRSRVRTERALDHYWRGQLSREPALFEAGDLDTAPDDEAFLRRLNTRIKPKATYQPIHAPRALGDAVDKDGRLHADAELLAFGQWLIAENAPGVVKRGGKPINPRDVLKTLATTLADLKQRVAKRTVAGGRNGPTPKPKLTKTILANRWADLFEEVVKTSDFDRRIATLKRLLPAYRDHLKTGRFVIGGKTVRKSPLIRDVIELLGAKSPQPATSALTKQAPAPPKRTPLDSTDLNPFAINLRYAASGKESEYRQRPAGALPLPELNYTPEPYQPHATGKSPPAKRQNHLVLAPDLDIAKKFRVTALLDRMALLINTTRPTTGKAICEILMQKCSVIAFAEDRTIPDRKAKDWRTQLPVLDLSLPTGHHFAVMIQEPTATSLRATLQAMNGEWEIVDPVVPFLIELAVDFYPDKDASTSSDERLILREQMVAALQRHHWCEPDVLVSESTHVPHERDARQVYADDTAKGSTIRFLFPRKKGNNIDSDQELNNPAVRSAILNTGTGEALMLNATLYHGAETGTVLIRIQHKIEDQRNETKKTSQVLLETERRARIEVQITGVTPLAGFGLNRVEDLSTLRFRGLRKNVMMFCQPLVPACKEDLLAAKQQLEYRGVYGWELWCRASEVEAKETAQGGRKRRKPMHVPCRPKPGCLAGAEQGRWPRAGRSLKAMAALRLAVRNREAGNHRAPRCARPSAARGRFVGRFPGGKRLSLSVAALAKT